MTGGGSGQRAAFGDILRHHRVAAGLTQEALAERAAMSARGISDLERGAGTHPYPATVRRLAEALELSDADRTVLERAATRVGRSLPASIDSGALPTRLSSFVGRERQVADVRRVLGAHRLVTLLGPGGIGKTRLAIEAAAGLGAGFPDGVVFVALANVRDPALVISAVAEALGIKEMGSRPLVDGVRARLGTAKTLVLLDNFEHVLPAADAVGALLADCARLHVLITSRVPLHLCGEHEVVVQPLALPDAHHLPRPELLPTYEAVRLFLERAQVTPSADDTTAIAEICIRLDGLPLALELAASRLRVLSPQMLRERLGHALPLLVGGPRDMPARQRTLTATIGWSHDLLDAAEQRLFRRIAVFVGCFTLEAVEAVCGDVELGVVVLDGIESLLEKSLLGRAEGARFRLLETVREFAVERAGAAGELATFRRRHAAYFLGLAEAAEFTSADAPTWLQRLEADNNNLRASLTWALEHEPETALRLSSAIWRFWYARGYLTEGARWLEAALSATEQTEPGRRTTRAEALTGAGVLAHYQGQYGRAANLCGQSLALCRVLGDRPGVAAALHGLALVARAGGDFAMARTMYEEARRVHEELDDRWGLSYTLRYLAVVLWMEADYAQARQVIATSLAVAREIGDGQGVAITLTVKSYVACSLGDHQAAEAAATGAYAQHQRYGDRRGVAQAQWALGMAVTGQGRHAEATALHKRALVTFSEIGDRYFTGMCFIGLAQCAVPARPRDAVRLLAADAAITADIGAPRWPSIRSYIQQTLDQARAVLDDTAFEEAWTSGEVLSVEQATALAMALPETRRSVARSPAAASPLTARELDVARRVARGLTNKQIAAELVIAEGTVDRHVANILGKLGYSSRAQVAAWVVEHAAGTGWRSTEPVT